MTTPILTERRRLTALRAAFLFDGTSSVLVRDPLILIDGDPLADPAALHRIRAVYARGTAVPDAGPSAA